MMIRFSGSGLAVTCLLVNLVWTAGCAERPTTSDSTVEKTASPDQRAPAPRVASQPAAPEPEPAPETPVQLYDSTALQGLSDADVADPVREPAVALSEEHQATCLIQVGDAFPTLTLPTLDGDVTPLSAHYGDRLTVVVFWDCLHPMAVEQISRLEEEVVRPYGAVGVSVVAINVGDTSEDQQNLLSQIDHSYVILQDSDRQAWSQVASELLPRTYLLNADGRVLWMDVEYSRSSRRELRNAILYYLRQLLESAERRTAPVMSAPVASIAFSSSVSVSFNCRASATKVGWTKTRTRLT